MTKEELPHVDLTPSEVEEILGWSKEAIDRNYQFAKDKATNSYIYRFRNYGNHIKRIRRELETARSMEQDGEPIDIRFQPLDEYLYHGESDGPRFAAWTEKNVYFRCTYDGSTWVASAPRNPSDMLPATQGGG